MLAVISPAKSLNFDPIERNFSYAQPKFLDQSKVLIQQAKQFSPQQLASLMKISDKLSALNVARYQQWQLKHDQSNAKAAIFAFQGDVYTGFDATSLDDESLQFSQNNLRILSGLYGILAPFDLIMPYRLEMGTKLTNPRGENLYKFWGDIITDQILADLKKQQANILVNLASDEYFKSVNVKKLQQNGVKIIKVNFLDFKNGKYKMISFYAKKARGLMCRFIAQHKISQAQQLESFNYDGYQFDEKQSSQFNLVFTRKL